MEFGDGRYDMGLPRFGRKAPAPSQAQGRTHTLHIDTRGLGTQPLSRPEFHFLSTSANSAHTSRLTFASTCDSAQAIPRPHSRGISPKADPGLRAALQSSLSSPFGGRESPPQGDSKFILMLRLRMYLCVSAQVISAPPPFNQGAGNLSLEADPGL